EIINAINATAKPYFGDVAQMTYKQMLSRLLEFSAIGRGGRYEDGIWPDISYRRRFLRALHMSEARLHPAKDKAFAAVIQHEHELDKPHDALKKFLKAYPWAQTQNLHAS